MDEYTVGISGDQRDIAFAAGICGGSSVAIAKHSQHGLMVRAPSVLTVGTPLEASRLSDVVLTAVNGLARTQDHDFRPLTKRSLYRMESDGVSLTEIPQILRLDVRTPWLAPAPIPDIDDLVRRAAGDPKASRVLKLMSAREDRWFFRYWLFELVLEDLGGSSRERENRAVERGWTSTREIRAFRATANWHETEGGRHAVPLHAAQEPPDLMHDLDAHFFIAGLVLQWFRSAAESTTASAPASD